MSAERASMAPPDSVEKSVTRFWKTVERLTVIPELLVERIAAPYSAAFELNVLCSNMAEALQSSTPPPDASAWLWMKLLLRILAGCSDETIWIGLLSKTCTTAYEGLNRP